ncbi:MAG: DUF5615 family PIN-like protein [Dehalococcoidia bacterium]
MNLLADEGVERQIVDRLRLDGHIVLYVAEMEPSIGDDVVLQRANEHTALLVTEDKQTSASRVAATSTSATTGRCRI